MKVMCLQDDRHDEPDGETVYLETGREYDLTEGPELTRMLAVGRVISAPVAAEIQSTEPATEVIPDSPTAPRLDPSASNDPATWTTESSELELPPANEVLPVLEPELSGPPEPTIESEPPTPVAKSAGVSVAIKPTKLPRAQTGGK